MENSPFDLPVDIPWTLIDSSSDMMDTSFCNKKYPSPFRSSLSIYAYAPKLEDLPAEYCGRSVTYLKVSCSITGFQPTAEEYEQLVEFLEKNEIDYDNIESFINSGEYLGCYGVLLNVSVHPDNPSLVDDLDQYPRIVDFEPKSRDFQQAASETGEVLTASIGKVSTTKGFSSTDSTQSSWKAGADVAVPGAKTGGADIGLKGETGQVRTETDQEKWDVQTDASRERRENQSTTTQLSQLYNLLSGYHAGTNRASFVMLPRPHILQATDRRTFVQGLRVIEGIQDFFLIVVLPQGQEKLRVDAHLQTGHFSENTEIEDTVPAEEQFETDQTRVASFSVVCLPLGAAENAIGQLINAFGGQPPFVETKVTPELLVFEGFEVDGWEFDTSAGDPGHRGVTENINPGDTLDSDLFTAISFLKHNYKTVEPDQVHIDISVKNKHSWPTPSAQFSRSYDVHLRRKRNIDVQQSTASHALLVTQRNLCTTICFGECIEKCSDADFAAGDLFVIDEFPFDVTDLYTNMPPQLGIAERTGDVDPPRHDFALKKAITERIQESMLRSANSPLRYAYGEVSYLQSRQFRKRLAALLPQKTIDMQVSEQVDTESIGVDPTSDLSIGRLLSARARVLARELNCTEAEVRRLRRMVIAESSGNRQK